MVSFFSLGTKFEYAWEFQALEGLPASQAKRAAAHPRMLSCEVGPPVPPEVSATASVSIPRAPLVRGRGFEIGERANFRGLVIGWLAGSAVSKPNLSKSNFASKDSLENSRRNLHNALLRTVLMESRLVL